MEKATEVPYREWFRRIWYLRRYFTERPVKIKGESFLYLGQAVEQIERVRAGKPIKCWIFPRPPAQIPDVPAGWTKPRPPSIQRGLKALRQWAFANEVVIAKVPYVPLEPLLDKLALVLQGKPFATELEEEVRGELDEDFDRALLRD